MRTVRPIKGFFKGKAVGEKWEVDATRKPHCYFYAFWGCTKFKKRNYTRKRFVLTTVKNNQTHSDSGHVNKVKHRRWIGLKRRIHVLEVWKVQNQPR